MEKISSRDAKALLKQAAASIRSLVDENKELQEKVASFRREERIMKIANDMESKKLSSELTFEEKIAALRTSRSLDVAEEAVKMASPQGLSLGALGDIPGAGDSGQNLMTFIMTGESPE